MDDGNCLNTRIFFIDDPILVEGFCSFESDKSSQCVT